MDPRASHLELKVLFDISHIIGQALNLNQTLEMILRILSEYLSTNRATITLVSGEDGRLKLRASHGLSPQERKLGLYNRDEGVTELIFRTGEPVVVPDMGKQPLFLNKTEWRRIDKDRISFIGVPVMLHGRAVGVLGVDRLFDVDISFEEDVRFLTVLAALVGQLVSLNYEANSREQNLISANLSLKQAISAKCRNLLAMGKSPAMLDVQQLIRKAAPTRATVLLLGESGSGKTLVAQTIHELSSRAGAPFVKVNRAALAENLQASEVFGYETGAFTGAAGAKMVRLEQAQGGTLFLDEIGELSLPLQAKLVRFIQDQEFGRFGADKTRTVDVRIIAATNKDVAFEVASGLFREDLYSRLNVFPIRVPPLRERREDIRPLIKFFSEVASREYGCDLKFTDRAMEALVMYSWPGNVREIENLVERMAIMAGNKVIETQDLLPYLDRSHRVLRNEETGLAEALRETEKMRVMASLERHGGVQLRAARELGITLRQMGYRVRKFGLETFVKQVKSRSPG